jgi:hypothetical protein
MPTTTPLRLIAAFLALLFLVPALPDPAAAGKKTDCRVEEDDGDDDGPSAHESKAKADRDKKNREAVRIRFKAAGKRGQFNGGHRFPINVDVIKIQMNWPHLTEPHLQRTEIYAPDGNFFTAFNTTFDPLRSKPDVEIDFPVVGTWVQQYGMVGTWCVVVFLDDGPEALAERAFTLVKPPARSR